MPKPAYERGSVAREMIKRRYGVAPDPASAERQSPAELRAAFDFVEPSSSRTLSRLAQP